MYVNRYHQNNAKRKNVANVSSALTLLTLGWLVMAFSVSASAQESQIDRETAQTYITEGDIQLSAEEEAFSQSESNVALIRQIGDGNTNTINQNVSRQGGANLASINQDGNYNDASIIQDGSNNTGLISQLGDRHKAEIIQDGNRLESQIIQNGQNSNVSISHSGSGSYGISIEQQAFSGNARSVTVETY
ncbi:hypothetical protein [Vreelandella maris]|uniref:Minor curlin subunit n=1 Tax=Vreelandella maris TaxID=2729617 RepID=A0A7Y6RBC2_9GAMM|nr:hypothetical protein [Halomonas maris]NVF13850.1 hypothetical protein [Halomonas maris]|tara:strand:- start:3954 stop:4523 length:570 start_codon:yes stop_codon:yes gene_type:complete